MVRSYSVQIFRTEMIDPDKGLFRRYFYFCRTRSNSVSTLFGETCLSQYFKYDLCQYF